MDFNGSSPFPEGVISFLDTDLYKLTMQCAVLQYYPEVPVTYAFKNRTPEKRLSRAAFKWLQIQINSKSLSLAQSPTFNRSKQFSDSRLAGGFSL
jgi:nicotinic acid phosphoribosyltransferase